MRVRLPPGLPPTFRGAVSRVSYFITCVAATADAREEAPDPPKAWERPPPARRRRRVRRRIRRRLQKHSRRNDVDRRNRGRSRCRHLLDARAGVRGGEDKKTRATLNPPSPRRASGDRRRAAPRREKNTTRSSARSASPPVGGLVVAARRGGPRLARNSGRTSGRRAPARRSPRRAGPPRTARRRPFRSTNRPRRTGIRPDWGDFARFRRFRFSHRRRDAGPPDAAADESWPW